MPKYILLERLYRRNWIFKSVLSSVVLAYEDYLRRHGYRKGTIHFYLASVAHFARWLDSLGFGLSAIDENLCKQFINTHLPHCSCPPPRTLWVPNIQAALNHLLAVLAEQGHSAAKEIENTPVSVDLEKFKMYMEQTRGLATNTCNQRLRIAKRLLLGAF